jgi:hypothetical protein
LFLVQAAERNLFISNSKMQKLDALLKFSRPFFVVVALLGVANFFALKIGDVAQEGTKQDVRLKRQWAKEDIISKEAQGKDVLLFLGNSKITAGIIPKLFDRALEGKVFSYNLSLPALPLAPDYFLLKDYLEHNAPPKYIILTLNPGDLTQGLFSYYAPLNAGLAEVVEYSRLRQDGDVLINYLLPVRFYWPEIKRYFISKALSVMPQRFRAPVRQKYADRSKGEETFRHDWGYLFDLRYVDLEKSAHQREELLKENRGYYYIAEQGVIGGALSDDYFSRDKNVPVEAPVVADMGPSDDVVVVKETEDPFVKKFFDLALLKGIKVFLISDYTLNPPGNHAVVFPGSWKLVGTGYHNVYFSKFGIQNYEPKYFSDPTHVNPQGAAKYTQGTAEEFKRIFY